MTQDAAVTAAAVAVALAAVEGLKEAVKWARSNGKDKPSLRLSCPAAERHSLLLERMAEIVSARGPDGAPMIYGSAGTREVLDELRKTNAILARIERNGGPKR